MAEQAVTPFSTAREMVHALDERRISAVELLDLHLERIAQCNSVLNAIVTPNEAAARQRAAAADRERADGAHQPLLGLPLTIKDCIDVAGLCGTAGVPDFANRYPEQHAPLATRVLAAGAVLLGKTNVPPFAGDWQANNPIFGRTLNPWDHERTPGGSTGGGAAALAVGMTPLEFGSDIGGSIRVPAAFCGLYGHRPSETAVPRNGHFPGSPAPNVAFVLGVQGPLARSAGDLELALDVIAGSEPGEDAWHLNLPPARGSRLADYRVALLPPIPWLPVDDEIMAASESLATTLRRAGAIVGTAQPDALGDLRDYVQQYLAILSVMTSQGTPEEQRRQEAEALRASGDPFDTAQADGLVASAHDLMAWLGQREAWRAAWRAFFRDWDVLVAPITLTPAFPHTDVPCHERRAVVNGHAYPYLWYVVPPALATLPGQPATAFPVGLSRSGLPLGLQAIGPYLEDRTPIRFAELVAEEIGGFTPPPDYRLA
jgi:amidase